MRTAAAVVVVAVAAVDTDCYDYNCWNYYYNNYYKKTWWCLVCLTRFPGGSWRETFLRVWTNEIIRWEQKVVYSGFPTRFQKRGKTTTGGTRSSRPKKPDECTVFLRTVSGLRV
jgi:hypothetical protein